MSYSNERGRRFLEKQYELSDLKFALTEWFEKKSPVGVSMGTITFKGKEPSFSLAFRTLRNLTEDWEKGAIVGVIETGARNGRHHIHLVTNACGLCTENELDRHLNGSRIGFTKVSSSENREARFGVEYVLKYCFKDSEKSSGEWVIGGTKDITCVGNCGVQTQWQMT